MTHPLYIVDVFAESKYAGNQLAVVRYASDLSTDQMQAIAREMHFSETTFVLSDEPRNGGYDVRIFTPANELPFAGHPTLGSAFVIQTKIIGKPVEELTLNLGVGPIAVSFDGDILWMKQIAPKFGETFSHDRMAAAMTLNVGDLDTRFPVQLVSTGVPFVIVPVKTLEAIKRARGNWDAYRDAFPGTPRAVVLFCPETYSTENNLNVRVFVDEFGVPEDPATGSGNGCLAGYLIRHRFWGKPEIDIRVEQGYEIQRPSLLYLRARALGDGAEVRVGGQVFMVARGELV